MERKEYKSSVPNKGRNESKQNKTKKSRLSTFVIIGIVAVGLLGGAYLLSGNRGTMIDYDSITDVSELRGWETDPILPSQRFLGAAARAYKVAAEIPDVMDSLYCYCNCMIHSGHKSLKTCFTNEHGANCGICIDQALRAFELHKEGKDILTIRKIIDKEFA